MDEYELEETLEPYESRIWELEQCLKVCNEALRGHEGISLAYHLDKSEPKEADAIVVLKSIEGMAL